MCILTLSALRLTKRGTGSPLAEPADCACAALVQNAPAQRPPAHAAKTITNRARLACLIARRKPVWSEPTQPGAFVLKRPSDREGRAPPAPRWAAGEFRRARLKRTERAGKKRELRTTRE